MLILQLAGLPKERDVQAPASAVTAIRWMASVGTSSLVLLAAYLARGYPLTRERHNQILAELEAREEEKRRSPRS